MHISEGVLSPPVLIAGAAIAVAGVAYGLKRTRQEQIMLCGLLSAAFFVASLIHVPVGFASAHLLFCGLLGVLCGWGAFPAIFTALFFQALLFQYGGLTTLGVNTASMGLAAIISWYIFLGVYRLAPGKTGLRVAAFCGGFSGVCVSALLTSLALAFTDEGFYAAAAALLAAHLPVMLVEGVVTMFAAGFIARVKPDMLALNTFTNARGSVA